MHLARIRFPWIRTFSTCPPSPIEHAALRKANGAIANASYKSKLDKIAKPFNSLLAPYYPNKKIHGVSSVKREGLGFGLQEQDLEAVNARTPLVEKLLSLEMSSQSELKRHRIHQAMEIFCRRTNDTGSPEVQAAIWSVKIAALENHVRQFKHDYVAERKIVFYKDQRRKILRYLKRVSLERFFACVDKLGLPHDLVEAATSRFPAQKIKWPKTPKGQKKLETKRRK